MALISRKARPLAVPGEDGEYIEIRSLTGAEMDEAQESRTQKMLLRLEAMGDLVKNLPAQEARAVDTLEARREAYDPDILIDHAVTGWSYQEPLNGAASQQLDARTRDWLWSVIVEANTRPPGSLPGGGPS
jgi:hypothetical protein